MLSLRATKQKIEAENTQLRMFNLEAKHSQLKQQLHPHFLFNSLSNLRSLIKRSPAQAEDYLEKLSRLLRLSIQSNLQTMVSVQEEIELTENYLDLQRLRFGEALQFFIEMPLDMKKFGKVPVYSIQLLVENAIKHNRITAGQPLKIHVTGDLIQRTITVENNFQPKPHLEEGSGVGLNNLKERYRLLNNDDIRVVRSPDKFIVTIKVWINESSDH
jgi:LytS/YehU family sensor histidine kinase